MKHHPYSKSFASRLTWRIILVLIVMLSGTFGLIFYISHAALKVEETNHYESFLNITNERVGHVLTAVAVGCAINVLIGFLVSLILPSVLGRK